MKDVKIIYSKTAFIKAPDTFRNDRMYRWAEGPESECYTSDQISEYIEEMENSGEQDEFLTFLKKSNRKGKCF